MSIRVLAPGLLTTVQDGGRTGSRHLGVGIAGALDPYSHAVANLLVGNAIAAATLEITLAGPTLAFGHATRIAICGATIDARVDGLPLPGWRPAWVPAGAVLSLGACRDGARAYLAIAGGVRVASVLGSLSTDLRGGFGGHCGRALARGDVLALAPTRVEVRSAHAASWWIDPSPDLQWERPPVARVLAGPHPDGLRELCVRTWHVANASNRQGLRLEGRALHLAESGQRVSEPVAPGTIQLPSDGQPIVLLSDAQTHGGYPRIGHVIRADWPQLAQLRPGDPIRFQPCTESQARQARREQSGRLARMALAIAARDSAPGG